jgi:hypothetical protein
MRRGLRSSHHDRLGKLGDQIWSRKQCLNLDIVNSLLVPSGTVMFPHCSRAPMADASAIEWTDSTWNPVTGCTQVTAGCDNCYAKRFSERWRGTLGHPFENGFDLTLRPERLKQPLNWRRPRLVFVNSMSDLFHKDIPTEFIDRVFDTMEAADWHVFQVLTKRSSLMRDYLRVRYSSPAAGSYLCPTPLPGGAHAMMSTTDSNCYHTARIQWPA